MNPFSLSMKTWTDPSDRRSTSATIAGVLGRATWPAIRGDATLWGSTFVIDYVWIREHRPFQSRSKVVWFSQPLHASTFRGAGRIDPTISPLVRDARMWTRCQTANADASIVAAGGCKTSTRR
jgi:hypothetical protein